MEADMSEELAALQAIAADEDDRARLGSLAQAAEASRSVWTWQWLEQLSADTRYAARTMRRSPGFTVTAVLLLALGIGANSAIFGLMNAILLKPLPVASPESLVVLTSYSKDGKIGDFGYGDYRALRDGAVASAAIIAASWLSPVEAAIGGESEQVRRKIVSENYFEVLGVRPFAGRLFQPGDNDQPAAVISHGWWKRGFGGGPVIGQQIKLDGMAFPIVGVAPAEFLSETTGEDTDVWASIPLMPVAPRTAAGFTWLNLMGRLKPGVSAQSLKDVLPFHLPSLQNRFIDRIEVEPGGLGGPGLRDTFRTPLRALMAVVIVVLLITCANLAGLLLSRAASRQKEIATRLAIGAGRGRLFRQLMTESLLLAVLGGLLALLFAVWGQRFLMNLVSGVGRTISLNLMPDTTVLAFTAAISLGTGILFGLAPALHAVRGVVSNRHGRWGLREALLSFQVALSMLLLVAGGLFIRTLHNLKNQDLGLRAGNVVTVQLDTERGYQPQWAPLTGELLRRLEAIPGVTSATAAMNGTLANASGIQGFQIEGQTSPVEATRASANWVGPKYFETLGIPILEGRGILPSDHAASQRIAVVNQAMVSRFLGNQRPIGAKLLFNGAAYDIVGVARDSKYNDLREQSPPFVYFAALQNNSRIHSLEIRTAAVPASEAIRAMVRQADPRLRVVRMATLNDRIEQKVARETLLADLSTLFGALTLTLVIVGIYGSLAYAVARRNREIGIRLALGARASAVARTVMKDVLIVSSLGLVAGTAASIAAGRLLSSLLFGLGPADPATIALAALLLITAALAAGILPVLRACHVDPASTLRLE